MIPLGKAKVVRAGRDLTVVTYGAVVQRSLVAAKELEERRRVSVEVIDLRTLCPPVDWEAIRASVIKTNKVLVAYEDARSWVTAPRSPPASPDECFPWLDAPGASGSNRHVRRYAPRLEDFICTGEDSRRAMRDLHAFSASARTVFLLFFVRSDGARV